MCGTILNRNDQKIFEDPGDIRFNAKNPGQLGVGGEYKVQQGFGRSVGVILEILAYKYSYQNITSSDSPFYYEVPEWDLFKFRNRI